MIGIHSLSRAAAAACIAAAALPAAADACVIGVFSPWHDGAHLIATATADTVPAGDGGISGQVMRMERLGGPDADSVGEGADRVVLVPWAHDAECRLERWTGSARWAPPGERGLFLANLRPRERWVDGVPTFDVFVADQFPFPQRVRDMPPGGAASLLTAEQVFEVMELLPRFAEYRENRGPALRPLLEWARAHLELARRYPASEMLAGIGDAGG
ncbi:MAG TPA: hypothetical protein VFR37_10135 [Longimicrobium sp.]|nr:hypothetical protein [Longimicrobium sp.]